MPFRNPMEQANAKRPNCGTHQSANATGNVCRGRRHAERACKVRESHPHRPMVSRHAPQKAAQSVECK